MKRLAGSLLCVSMLFLAGQAQAALLTEWTYTLHNAYFEPYDGRTVLPDSVTFNPDTPEHVGWDSAMYINSAQMNDSEGATGNFTFSETKDKFTLTQSNVLSHGTKDKTPITGMPQSELIALTFHYSVASVENPNVYMETWYTINLQTYYDPSTETEYIFYHANDASGDGATAFTHDGFKYGLSGVGLYVDGRSLTGIPGSPGYVGWAINSDTRTYKYDKYVVGATDNVIKGTKTTFGEFNITGQFSVTHEPYNEPAPTPEPATMLLMGAGLAGLGFAKRRRQS